MRGEASDTRQHVSGEKYSFLACQGVDLSYGRWLQLLWCRPAAEPRLILCTERVSACAEKGQSLLAVGRKGAGEAL